MTSPPTILSKFLSFPFDIGVLAVGFSGGQVKEGTEAAPGVLIESGLLDQLEEVLGYNIHWDNTIHEYEDLIPEDDPRYRGMRNPLAVSAVTQKVTHQVYDHAKEGRMVLNLGGDHSIAIGTISGTAKAIKERLGREIAVIWVDAHGDINTPETSVTGNIHGMPAAWLTRLATEERADVFGWLGEEKYKPISLKKLVYIALRDLDPPEKDILKREGITAFTMHDIDRHGIGRVVELALAHIGMDTPIYLSLDVDALDPMFAPSTGTPVRRGLTLREGNFICEAVHETGSLVGMDFVEINPKLEEHGKEDTVRTGISLVRCALGDTLL